MTHYRKASCDVVPITNHEAIIEAAFEALQEETGYGMSDDNAREFVRIVLKTATPLILEQAAKDRFDINDWPLVRAAALEEAAKVAEDFDGENIEDCNDIAAAIRALKEQP